MTTDLSRTVLYFLGAGFILALVGIVVLTALERPVHDVLPLVISNVIVGALGILSPRPGTQDVNVVNTPADPVPVDDKPRLPPLPADNP